MSKIATTEINKNKKCIIKVVRYKMKKITVFESFCIHTNAGIQLTTYNQLRLYKKRQTKITPYCISYIAN